MIRFHLKKTLVSFFLTVISFQISLPFGMAQVSNATIQGTVRTSDGAVLPSADVELTNDANGEKRLVRPNDQGYYTFEALSPGRFSVRVSALGFENWVGTLTLRVAQNAEINPTMKLGSVETTVTVQDVTPVIDVVDATISDVKEATRIETLPLENSNFLNVLNFSPGVVAGSYAGQGGGYTRVNGVVGGSMTFQVDGQSANDRFTNELQATPQALQTIQELKVTTSNGSAEYGTPGVVEVVTKSGTNQLHGQLHELYQSGGFEAKSFNQSATTPHLVRNEFGGQVGGPVIIPKLYNGQNKTFFYFDVEQQIQHSLAQDYELVPQTNWTQGDFSNYVDMYGSPVTIYDPNTTGLGSNGLYTRQPFPGNKIPVGRINPIAAKIMGYLPKPNVNVSSDGVVDTSQWNYGVDWQNPLSAQTNDIRRYTGKVDQLFGKNLLSARYTYTNQSGLGPAFGGSSGTILNAELKQNLGHNGVISFTEPIGAHAVNEARVGIQYFNAYSGPQPIPGLIASLGLPIYPGAIAWPGFYWDDNWQMAMAGIDRNNPKSAPNQNVTLGDNFSWSHGAHEVKVGFQVVNSRLNTVESQNPGGNYNFSGVFTALDDPNNPGNSKNDTGSGLADFLLGDTDLSYLGIVPVLHTRQTDYDGFVQDDWKVSHTLTLNLGLRYEYWSPFTDGGGLSANLLFNNNTSGTCSIPASITGGGTQQCVAAGTAGYPAWFSQSEPNVVIPDSGKGQDPNVLAANIAAGLPVVRASTVGLPSSLWNMPKNNVAPRVGFAFLADPKTVIRGGYGIYYWTMPLVQYHQNTRDNAPWTESIASYADNAYSNCSYGGPCPSELAYPIGAVAPGSRALGLPFISTTLDSAQNNGGWQVTPWDTNYKAQRAQEWNLTVERALPGSWSGTISYIGNHGDHLVNYDPINALLPRSLTPAGPNQGSVATRRTYPLFAGSGQSGTDRFIFEGFSNHDEIRAEAKHVVKGSFIFQSYFIFGKTLTTSEGQANSFGGLEVFPAVLTNNAPLSQRLLQVYARDSYLPGKSLGLNGHYELPFGAGKRFLNSSSGVVKEVVTGWNSSVFYLWRSGLPFAPYYSSTGSNITFAPGAKNRGILPKDQRTASRYFDGSVWDPASGTAYNGQTFEKRDSVTDLANFSSDLLNGIPRNYMTGPGFWNADGTVYKVTPLGEHAVLDLELQVFNIFNHVSLGQPSTSGAINSGIGQQRLLQFQGKITF